MTQQFHEIVKRIDPSKWPDTFQNEYLNDFIPSGGAAVRFVSGDSEVLSSVRNTLRTMAESRSMWYRLLDPRTHDLKGRPVALHRIEVGGRGLRLVG